MSQNKQHKSLTPQQLTAAIATAAIALLLLLLFLLVKVYPDSPFAQAPHEEKRVIMPMDEEEELFVEAVLEEIGEMEPAEETQPAAAPIGEPEKAPEKSDVKSVSGENPKENVSTEKLVATNKESKAKTAEPSKKDKPDSKITDEVANAFAPNNGKADGKDKTAGNSAGQEGTGSAKGNVNGRRLLSYDKPKAAISKPISVVVAVKVDATGKTIFAECRTSLQSSALKAECERAALTAKWSAAPGAPTASGTITWNLVPRK